MRAVKKYIGLAVAAVVAAAIVALVVQHGKIKHLRAERDTYQTNTRVLMEDVRRYQTRDSLNVATIGVLELKLSEFKKYRAEDAELIKSLKVKNRDLEAVTTAQMQTITDLRAELKDSIVYLPGDTVERVVKCIEYRDRYLDVVGCVIDNVFSGEVVSRDSLTIVNTVQYKRFWGFLWKTKKVKNRQIDVVSKNPHTQIMGVEYIEIEKK